MHECMNIRILVYVYITLMHPRLCDSYPRKITSCCPTRICTHTCIRTHEYTCTCARMLEIIWQYVHTHCLLLCRDMRLLHEALLQWRGALLCRHIQLTSRFLAFTVALHQLPSILTPNSTTPAPPPPSLPRTLPLKAALLIIDTWASAPSPPPSLPVVDPLSTPLDDTVVLLSHI